MHKSLLLISLFFTGLYGYTQTYTHVWAEQGVQNGSFCRITATATDQQANTYICFEFSEAVQWGNLSLTPSAGKDIGVVKFDSLGIALWAVSGGSNFDDRVADLAVNESGQVFITGSLRGDAQFGNITLNANTEGGSQEEFFIASISSAGNWLWAEIQNGGALAYGSAIVANAEGNAVVTGVYSVADLDFGGTVYPAGFDRQIFIVSYSVNGEVLWSKLGACDFGVDVYDIVLTPYGFALCGTFGTSKSDQTSLAFGQVQMINPGDEEGGITVADMFVAGFDPSGTCLWGRNAGSLYFDAIAYHLACDALGNVVVSGEFYDELTTDDAAFTVSAPGEEGNVDYFLAGISASGNWLWLNAMNNEEGGFEFTQVRNAPNGSVVFGGILPGSGHTFGTIQLNASTGQEGFLAELNPSTGSFLWARNHPRFELFSVGSGATPRLNFSIAGLFTQDLQLGSINLPLTGGAGEDAYVCRFDYVPLGNTLNHGSVNQGFIVYPNPSESFLNIEIPNLSAEPVRLSLFNAVGQLLFSDFIQQPQFTLNAKALDLVSGVYFVQLIRGNEISTQRWVLK